MQIIKLLDKICHNFEQRLKKQPSFFVRVGLSLTLIVLYIIQGIVHGFFLLFYPSTTSFQNIYSLNPAQGYRQSYVRHYSFVRNLRVVSSSAIVTVCFITTLINLFFLSSHPVYAATCAISGDTTINQAYIDSNSCGTINISGTITVTWSGTTDLVGAGDVNITSGTVTFSGAAVLGATDSMTIASGATVTHAAQNTTGVNITAANLTVAGFINVNAKGCAGAVNGNGYGPDVSTGVCTQTTSGYGLGGNVFGAGGSYGGLGTAGASGLGGTTYGSNAAPALLGSSGGASTYNNTAAVGAGGGKIRLNISGTLTNAGVISATGGVGASSGCGTCYAGSGSGGSVYVTTGTLAGAGTITATGGTRADSSAASGGGGRVAVYYTTNDGFTLGNITAAAGTGASAGSSFILNRYADDGLGTLTITTGLDFQSDGDYSRTNITVSSGASLTCGSFATLNVGATSTLTFSGITWTCSTVDTINISAATWTTSGTNVMTLNKAGAVVDWNITNNLTLNNLTYTGGAAGTSSANGGVLSMDNAINVVLVNTDIISNLNFTGLSSVNLDSQSSLSANAKGCAGVVNGNGYGPNVSTGVCTQTTSGYGLSGATNGAGGSHGGLGTAGGSGLGGTTYGSNTAPTLLGSSGGASTYSGTAAVGAGGGKIRLDISGTLTNAGIISATGGVAATFAGCGSCYAGSGSGGSVYVTTGTLAGAGTITATGGERSDGSAFASSGGGGRVAVYYATNDGFTLGNITAAAGTGASVGTVYTLQYTAPTTPSISSPTTGVYNVSVNPTLTSSTYASNGAAHTTSDWKITSDSGGLTTVWSKTGDASNLTSIVVNSSNGTFASGTALANNTLYYTFVRHTNVVGNSSWSSAVSFTTTAVTNTSTKTWDFGTASDYTYNSTYADITSGLGLLKDLGSGTYGSGVSASLDGWSKRKTITITEASGSTLTNYQTLITVTYDADMQADFDDIRFTSSNGTTLLDYWLESKTDSTTATFWVEVPTLTASSANTIYMYYGNSGVSTTSSGANTFVFFDDFSGATLDAVKWTGSATLSGGIATVGQSATHLRSITTFGVNTSAVWRVSMSSSAYGFAGYWNSGNQLAGYYANYQTGSVHNAISQVSSPTSTSLGAKTGYQILETMRNNGTNNQYYVNHVAATTISSQVSTQSMPVDIFAQSQSVLADWVFVRTYTATEPTVSISFEEIPITYDQVSILNVASTAMPTFVGLGTFTETRGVTGGQGNTYYNLSLNGSSWKYWNGSAWATASSGNYTSAADVNNYLPQFTTDVGKGNLYFKAFLLGSNQPVEIDNLAVTYAPLNVSLSAATQSLSEAVGTGTVTAQLSSSFTSDVVIPYTVSGTATGSGTDHNLANGNITVTAGATTGGVSFNITNDSIDESDETVVVTLGTPNYGALFGTTEQTVTITDNDTAGTTVGTISGNTTEAGGTATATIVLTSQPTADVTIGLSSSNTAEGTVSPASFTFTSSNWNTPQTVTATGANDAIDDGDITYAIVTAAATSADSTYNNLNPANISVTNTDNDTAGITVGPISGNTTEAGGTATFTLVLNTQPIADVSIGLTSSNTAEGTVSPASVTFTSGNWNTPQTITATGVNDNVDDGDIGYSIVTAAATSADGQYNTMNASDVSATNTDNDTAGITVGAISGNTTEAGGTATFTIVLNTQPTADVTIGVSSNDTTEGTVSPSTLTFTTANWNDSVAHAITVTGVDDVVDDGNIIYSIITAAATSADGSYNTMNAADVTVTNTDGDTGGVTIIESNGSTTVSEGGTTDTYSLVLTSQPTSDVVVTLTPNSQISVNPTSRTFTSANWNTSQTVAVSAVRDIVVEGSHIGSIVHTATSADANYNGVSISSLIVTIADNIKPTANAGSDVTIAESAATTTLSGTTSTDADGDTITSFAWTETSDSGDACSLSNSTTATPTVTVANKESSYDCIFQLIVNDGYIDSSADSTTMHVTAINDPPAIGSLANSVSVNEGSQVVIMVAASDADSPTLSLSALDTFNDFTTRGVAVSSLFSIVNNFGTFTWTPNNAQAGDYRVDFAANDGTTAVTEQVMITVQNVNQAPAVSASLPNVSFVSGTTSQVVFNLNDYFLDPDEDTLTYDVQGNNAIIASIADNGEVQFTASADFVGTEDMAFVATDPVGLSVTSNEIDVTVSESEGNATIDHITGQSRGAGLITIYDHNNEIIGSWQAFSSGGVIPKIAEINNQTYVFAIKKTAGTTIHIYQTDGTLLSIERLSPNLHYRHLAIGNINTTKQTEEVVVSTRRGRRLHLKLFSYYPNTTKFKLIAIGDVYVKYLNYRIDIRKNNTVVFLDRIGNVIDQWKPL